MLMTSAKVTMTSSSIRHYIYGFEAPRIQCNDNDGMDDVTDVLVLVTYSILFLLLLIFSFFSIRFSCVSCVRLSLDCTVACRGRARVAMDRFPFPVVRHGKGETEYGHGVSRVKLPLHQSLWILVRGCPNRGGQNCAPGFGSIWPSRCQFE